MQGKYINPYTDFGFKRIFGQEANKDILISFLNSLLPQKHQVADLRFLNTERTPHNIELHTPILDIFCESPSGEQFIVEMQKKNQALFLDRSVYYTACAIRDQVERGRKDYDLVAVYFIGIMDFTHKFNDGPPRLITEVSLKDNEGRLVYNKLLMYFVQMPLFTKTESELVTQLDKWFWFLQNLPDLDHIPSVLGEPVFAKAFETAKTSVMTREERLKYHQAWDALVTTKDMVETALAEGLAEGLAKGLAEGLAEGKAEGLAEANRENAIKIKAAGIPSEIITQITGIKDI